MPIFDYKCNSCNNTFERLVKSSDTEVKCESCGKHATKLVSTTRESGVVLKGEGFYKKSPSSW